MAVEGYTIVTRIVDTITTIYGVIPFSAPTWFVIGILLFFIWIFAKASRDEKSHIDWEDLFIDHDTQRTSPYKLSYVVGMIVGTWVIVTFTDSGKLTWDIFSGYLAYLLGGAGWAAAQTKPKTPVIPAPAPAPAPDPEVK